MLRVIKETQARWVVGENVQGIVNMSKGKSCKEYTMIWKPSVTKSKLLLSCLVCKEHGTKETEFGSLLPTPTASCLEGGEQSNRVERSKTGKGFILRKKTNRTTLMEQLFQIQ